MYMTIDVISALTDRMTRFPARSTRDAIGSYPGLIDDVIVIFGGWGEADGGAPLQRTPVTGTTQLWERLEALPSTPLHRRHIGAWNGSVRDSAGVDNAFRFIRKHFHPLGRIIVCGYSAGGFDAMRLVSHISMASRFYEVRSKTFVREIYRMPQPGAEIFGFVRVDLLVTVDAAQGPLSGLTFRRVFPSARRNLNYYQGTGSSIGSHGGPNVAMDPNATEVVNLDLSRRYAANPGAGHGQIDNDTIDYIVEAVEGVLGREAVPRLLPPEFATG
jgi:hypothetical protein